MKRIKKALLLFIIILSVIFIGLYTIYLYAVPAIINSVKTNDFAERMLYNKTGIELTANNFQIKTFKDLSLIIFTDYLELKKSDKKVLEADNVFIKLSPLKKQLSEIQINYIYIDKTGLSNLFQKTEKKQHQTININSISRIKINKIEIDINNINNSKSKIYIDDITSEYNKEENLHSASFNAQIQSTHLKNNILVNNKDNIKFNNKSLKIQNLKIQTGNSILNIDGEINPNENKQEIHVTGKDIPVHDIQISALYYIKLKNPNKNFMENFKDYSGSIDIDLYIRNKNVNGTVLIKSLEAKTVMFGVPIKFKDFTGYFNGDEISAQANGTLGFEEVFADFYLSHYDKERRHIYGKVRSLITNKSASKYMPDFKIEGKADATVSYEIKNSIPKITYMVKLDEKSNLEYKTLSLGMSDKKRRLFVRTEKYPDKLYITDYDYSMTDGADIYKVLTGEGLFEKINNKIQPSFVTIKTNTRAPVSVTGSFGKRLEGGTFDGSLKYDFKKNILTGIFNLSDSKYKDFRITTADINADDNIAVISSEGTYLNSPYKCYINMNNKFTGQITVHDIDLFLDEYKIKKKNTKNTNKQQIKIPEKAKELDYLIKKGNIRLNKLIYKKILIENIAVSGTLENDLIQFKTEKARFAKGNLSAQGIYNINNKDAVIDFWADNIDSNSTASMIFNLNDEIEGTADAELHAKINTETHSISAKADFSINTGYLNKIGSTEFIIKGANKKKKPLTIRLSDIINIDISKAKAMASDIKGSFNMEDWSLENINLFSKQKYLSLFIEGNYNIEDEDADLKLWGKYNKTARNKVKVLFIPLSVIMKIVFKEEQTKHLYCDKINQIPAINAENEEIEFFSVKINGNLNKNDVNIELKSIK